MLSRSVKFAHVVLLVFTALASFLFLRGMEQLEPLEASAHVVVEDDPARQPVSSTQETAAVEAVARAQGVTIARETPDLGRPENLRHLYLAVGDPQAASAAWLRAGYPAFSDDMRTVVHPLSEARYLEPRGDYYVFGAPQARQELVAALDRLGFRARGGPLSLSTWFSESTLGPHAEALEWCLLAVMLAAVIAVGAGVVLNARAYGVLRLQGYGFGRIAWRDLTQLGVFWVRAAAVVAAGVLGGLWLYNGLAGRDLFALVCLALLGVSTLAAVLAHVLALMLTQRVSLLGALKGEVSAPLTLVSIYGVRIVAALLALTIADGAVDAGQQLGEYQVTREAYARLGPATHIQLKGRESPRESARQDDAVGSWLRQLDREGHLLLTVNMDRLGDYSMLHTGDPHRNMLVVNEAVLARQAVLDPSGLPIRSAPPSRDKVRVLVPQSLPGDPATVADAVTTNFRMGHTQQGFSPNAKALDVQTVPTKAGQSIFTFGAGVRNKVEYRSFVRDPVIVVLSDSAGLLENSFYSAYASEGYVAVSDPQEVLRALGDPQLRGYLYSLSPVAQQAAVEYRDAGREVRLTLLDAAAALGVLGLTGMAVVVVYTRKRAQTVFVRYISGWTFTKTHLALIAVESALAAFLAGWTGWDTWTTMRLEQASPSTKDPLPLGGWEPVVMVGITGIGAGITLATLALLQRRLVRNRSAEA